MSGVLVSGSLIHYETFGRGSPVVFVHGWLGSWRYWVPVMEDLATDHRTYALDLWGFGDSDKGRETYDVDGYVQLLLTFMDELGVMRAPIVGHTLGAAIAVRMAARHPDRVSKVLAVGLPLAENWINRKLLTAGPNDTLARLFWHKQRPYGEVEMAVPKMAKNAIALTIQSVARVDLHDTLDDIEVPLLTVYGDRDVVVDPSQVDVLEENHYAARAIVLDDAYHFPMLDQTARFARLLRDFLDIDTPEQLQELTIKREWRRRTR
ncbi:MAG TPA: alpha/beta fold hydrolase [Anaerolineae bacterium]|jgi:3-oxoadipate enol-lactonase|nr:alpha/beta fold hydrolase [Anaerolineae bacterium]